MNSFGDESLSHLVPASAAAESPAARQLEDRQLVEVALAGMTSRQRVVLLQHELRGDTPAEIAAYLKITESRVRGILAEAKAAGRKAIERALRRPKEALSLTS